MKDLFDQMTQTMQQGWNMWLQMMGRSSWLQPEVDFTNKWSSWVVTMRSAYDANMNTWKTFMEQSEELFFQSFKQCPFHNEALESQWREVWDGMKRAQTAQQEVFQAQLDKMEELLKKE